MNEQNYRQYSQAFKLEALELLRRGYKSAGHIVIQCTIRDHLCSPLPLVITATIHANLPAHQL